MGCVVFDRSIQHVAHEGDVSIDARYACFILGGELSGIWKAAGSNFAVDKINPGDGCLG